MYDVPLLSRTEAVLETIKRRILAGQLAPGQALVETELAQDLGVSKTPVREALKTLAGTGLVTMSRYKGVRVRVVDEALARSVYDVRLLLEPEAVRRSVQRGDAALAAAAEALRGAADAEGNDRATRSLRNRAFHRALYEGCGNPLLIQMLDELKDQAALVSVAAWGLRPTWSQEAEEHRRILDRAREGDADGAAELLAAHIRGFVARSFPEVLDPH